MKVKCSLGSVRWLAYAASLLLAIVRISIWLLISDICSHFALLNLDVLHFPVLHSRLLMQRMRSLFQLEPSWVEYNAFFISSSHWCLHCCNWTQSWIYYKDNPPGATWGWQWGWLIINNSCVNNSDDSLITGTKPTTGYLKLSFKSTWNVKVSGCAGSDLQQFSPFKHYGSKIDCKCSFMFGINHCSSFFDELGI